MQKKEYSSVLNNQLREIHKSEASFWNAYVKASNNAPCLVIYRYLFDYLGVIFEWLNIWFFFHAYVCIEILEIIKSNLSDLCSSFVLQRWKMTWNYPRKHSLIFPLLLSLWNCSTNLQPDHPMISLLEMFYLQRRVKFRGTSLAGNFVHSIGDATADMLLVETKKGFSPSKTTDHTEHQDGLLWGSYYIGGSPIGRHFLLWPGWDSLLWSDQSRVVGSSICKMKFHPPVPAI